MPAQSTPFVKNVCAPTNHLTSQHIIMSSMGRSQNFRPGTTVNSSSTKSFIGSVPDLENGSLKTIAQEKRRLCGDCDQFKYCLLAKGLTNNYDLSVHGHHQANNINIKRARNGAIQLDVKSTDFSSASTPITVNGAPSKQIATAHDYHALIEKLKLRHKTCPFHQELSQGFELLYHIRTLSQTHTNTQFVYFSSLFPSDKSLLFVF